MKLILFNGPSGSGKTEAAQGIVDAMGAQPGSVYVAAHHHMAETLKPAICALYGVDPNQEWLETQKDTPTGLFLGRTFRWVLDALSEDLFKEQMGVDMFARILANRLVDKQRLAWAATGREYLCVCSSVGYAEELYWLSKSFGACNILLIKTLRHGAAFNDRRRYIETALLPTRVLSNNGTVEELRSAAAAIAHDWLRGFNNA